MTPIQDHPLRYPLVNELHARPFPLVDSPGVVAFLAIKQPRDAAGRDRGADLAHLTDLLDRHGAAHPPPGATHYSGRIGRHMLKWEQHAEFVTYTAFSPGAGARPFDPAAFAVFPDDWLGRAPGQRITSVLMEITPHPGAEAMEQAVQDWFVPESMAISDVLDASATAAGDFRIDPAGHMRFAVFVRDGTNPRRTGRIVQRLLEVETYRAMSMLGFARGRDLAPRILELDQSLSDLMADMTGGDAGAEQTLQRLLSISAELEAMAARSSFRFGASGAYEAIAMQRVEALRETRLPSRQSFADFMQRRYQPAMRTVKSTESRLQGLADRAVRAADLLRTRVDVERSAQNRDLLASMDRRAASQLRLQHTVEGLSVVAISYYAVSLAGYLLYPLTATFGVGKGILTATITLPVVVLVWLALRRIRNRLD